MVSIIYCRLTPPLQGTSAIIRINLLLPEKVIALHIYR